MEDILLKIDPIYTVTALILAITVIIFGIKFTFDRLDKYFTNIDNRHDKMEKRMDKMNNKITLLFIEHESTDEALNKCLEPNGETYMTHKDNKKKALMQDVDYVNRRFG